MQRAALIVNTRSRSGERAFSQALDFLTASGVPLETTYALRDPARLPETVREAIAEDHDLIILGGGDSSVSSAVDLLAGTETPPMEDAVGGLGAATGGPGGMTKSRLSKVNALVDFVRGA